MKNFSRLMVVALLVATGLGLTGPAKAGTGPSTHCNDSPLLAHDDVPIAGGPHSIVPDTPVTLGVEFSVDSGGPHLALCYSTTPYNSGDPAIAGGQLAVGANDMTYANPTRRELDVTCSPDPGTQGVFCDLGLDVLRFSTGSVTGGQEATFTIPYTVCFGPCFLTGAVRETGVVVGSVGVDAGSGASIPVCVLGTCVTVPLSLSLGTGGLGTVYVDGTAIPLPGTGCIVSVNDPTCP